MTRSRRSACRRLLTFAFVFALAVFTSRFADERASAQDDVTDTDLASASLGHTVRVGSTDTGRVTTIALEMYVARVLAGEGEPRALDAAQQALAVAIRTFAVVNAGRHRRDGFDLCDTTHCQVLRAATAVTRRAAMATAGQVLIYQGVPAEVFYSASCGGQSESAADVWPGANYPYLRSVPDDVHEDDQPWVVDITLRQAELALKRVGFEGSHLRDIEVDSRSGSGRVARLRVRGLEPEVISGDQFRAAIGFSELRSTAFSIVRDGARFHFTGRGYGHGVGMCVIGAGRRAVRGESFRAILSQYYPGLDLARIDDLAKGPLGDTAAAAAPSAAPSAAPAYVAPPSPAPASVAPSSAASSPAASPATAVATVRRSTSVSAHVPRSSSVAAAEIERMATRAHDELSKTLGTSVAPVTIELHATLDSFRLATGQPWWVNAVAEGTSIDLAPATVLEQRDGIDATIRIAMGELLMGSALEGRPAWVRVGAARYFARPSAGAPSSARFRCPSDAELTKAISAAAQRDAESRAEACFIRGYERTKDWRGVK